MSRTYTLKGRGFYSVITALFLSLLINTPSYAGEDGSPFNGTYIGLHINHSKVAANLTHSVLTDVNVDPNFGSVSSSSDGSGQGFLIYGGYDLMLFEGIHGGIEGGIGLNGGTGRASDGTNNVGVKAGFVFDVNARLGFSVSDQVYLYGIGGYSSTKFSPQDINDDLGSKSLNGYRYGAGVEFMVMEDMAVRAEYNRTEFGKFEIGNGADLYNFNPSGNTIRIGLVLHMN